MVTINYDDPDLPAGTDKEQLPLEASWHKEMLPLTFALEPSTYANYTLVFEVPESADSVNLLLNVKDSSDKEYLFGIAYNLPEA